MNNLRAGQSDFGYILKNNSIRGRLLKLLYCRCMLVCVTILVVLECLCVMAEMMVDLHTLRVRFKHENKELTKFVTEINSDGEMYNTIDSVTDLIEILKATGSNHHPCPCRKSTVRSAHSSQKHQDKYMNGNSLEDSSESSGKTLWQLLKSQISPSLTDTMDDNNNDKLDAKKISRDFVINRNSDYGIHGSKAGHEQTVEKRDEQIFVFAFVFDDSEHFFVRSFNDIRTADQHNLPEGVSANQNEYRNLHQVSHSIKYFGIAILLVMVIEFEYYYCKKTTHTLGIKAATFHTFIVAIIKTLLKILCLGPMFLKKKVEVFDACIVLLSFTLDLVFINSTWYENEKDITTLLVLLLPWRVVRILNSFLMTINHKHHIEVVNVRRAKKKVDTKFKKLKQLTFEMKNDIDHLVNLAKLKGATQPEIVNCLYSNRGRENKSLSAITGLASLMFISTLGKDTHKKNIATVTDDKDNAYSDLLRDIFSDDDTDAELTIMTETFENKDVFFPCKQEDLSYNISVIDTNDNTTVGVPKSNNEPKIQHKPPAIRRRVTLPRRNKCCGERGGIGDNNGIDNDGYDPNEDRTVASSAVLPDRSARSMSNIESANDGSNNILRFKFTTQLSYL